MIQLPNRLIAEPQPIKPTQNRFPANSEPPPEQSFRLIDPGTGKSWGYVVVDNTQRGPGLGGLRIAPDLTFQEVHRLAYAMTLKNSAANLPFGGGKSGLIFDPIILNNAPEIKSALISLFAEATFAIDQYISAPDMGTHEDDLQQIHDIFSRKLGTTQHIRGGAGRPTEKGGIPLDDWGLTAHSLLAAIQALEHLDEHFHLRKARVVIQGYGNVGSWTARKLHQAGALITGASDIHMGLWNPEGLDLDLLQSARQSRGGLSSYTGKVIKRFSGANLDWLLEAPCEILVPAARPDAITSKNADRIDCRVILQGANTPINKMTEYYLNNRRRILSLSDFIVNVGGVIGCAVELKMGVEDTYKERVQKQGLREYVESLIHSTISRNVEEIFARLKGRGSNDAIFREEALALARERLTSQPREIWL